MEEVGEFFNDADLNDSGELDAESFLSFAQSRKVQGLLRRLGVKLETTHLSNLFHLLDFDHKGKLNCEEFTMAVDQLSTSVSGIQFLQLRMDLKSFGRQLDAVTSRGRSSATVKRPSRALKKPGSAMAIRSSIPSSVQIESGGPDTTPRSKRPSHNDRERQLAEELTPVLPFPPGVPRRVDETIEVEQEDGDMDIFYCN